MNPEPGTRNPEPKPFALITGASGGIGEDLARLVAAGGADVALVARNAERLRALGAELEARYRIKATIIVQDLAAPDATERVMDVTGRQRPEIDILINNAGFGLLGAFAEMPKADVQQMLQLNIVTLALLARAVLPGMLQRKTGRILNIASTAAFQPGPFMAAYYASKAFVLSLSEALSNEVAGTGVTVTCLCPGPTRTGFQDRARVGDSRLMQLGLMDSAAVAREGYDAMMAGRSLVIPGLTNKIGVQALRLAPRRLATTIIRALHGGR